MKPQKLGAFLFSISIVLFSCRKSIAYDPPPVISADSGGIVGIIKEVAEILQEVYRDDAAYQEVNNAIASGYYVDERILLEDLLYPSKSALYRTGKFHGTGIFSRRFFEVLDKGGHPVIRKLLTGPPAAKGLTRSSVVSSEVRLIRFDTVPVVITPGLNNIAIYFPYSENFIERLPAILKPTIVAADRDADVGIGKEPYACSAGGDRFCYRDVTVDDNYAERMPTHIVTVGAQINTGTTTATPGVISTVYHGWSMLTRQMDKLISFTGNGGGSEIKIGRIEGYLKIQDQQVTNFSGDLVTVNYTRGDIRKKRWKRVYSVWDVNWNYQDVEQVYAVYEDDTQGEKTFSGSSNTTVSLPGKPSPGKVVGEIGFKVSVLTQDEIIVQRKINRTGYFRTGRLNQGWGFKLDSEDFLAPNVDWPIYDGGTIWSYTMPYQVY